MSEFIEKIEFNEDFAPFKGKDEIYFGGKKEVQELIKFYLKNKGVENAKKNSERFKINCVLGNNGGGKSRLFKYLMDDFISFENKKTNYVSCSYLNQLSAIEKFTQYICIEPILDDFFKLSGNIDNSVNKEVLENKIGFFLLTSFNFLKSNNEFIKIFSYFLKEDLSKNLILNIKFNKNSTKNIFVEIIKKLSFVENKFIKDKIIENKIEFKKYIKLIESGKLINRNFKETNNITYYIKNDPDFIYFYIIKSGILRTIVKFFTNGFDNISNHQKSNFDSNIQYLSEAIKDTKNEIVIKIKNLFDKLKNKKDKDELIDKNDEDELIKILKKVYISINENEFNKNIKITELIKFSNDEKDFFGNFFDINLRFSKKNFGDLSSGEKLIFIRFSNIYMKIIEEDEKFRKKLKEKLKNDLKTEKEIEEKIKKEPFETVILIDEPDLHLHLDWQKKYIQKLIDVFSTLDTNIKLHFIIATHSPFIISDLPSESIILLDKEEGEEYTKIKTYDGRREHKEFKDLEDYSKYKQENKTFGANFIDIIRDGFFFENKVLMGSFAENVIYQVAECERKKIFLDSLKFQLKYKEHEKENIKGQIDKINSLESEQIFKKLKDETKDILEKILKDILGDDFKKGDNKDDIFNNIENNYKNDIKKLKDNWVNFKKEKIDGEIKKIENDINSINKEIKGCENNIKKEIGDSFLKDNLLYFKKNNNAKD